MKIEYTILILSLVFAVFIWISDAVLGCLILREGSFWVLLISDVSTRQIYVRSLASGIIMIFGIIISTIVRFSNCAKLQSQADAQQRQVQLLHMSRTSAVSEMASGLVHELNQPLTAIIAFAEGCLRLMRSGKCTSEEITATMEQVANQAYRAGEVIRHVRLLVAKRKSHRSMVNINNIVHEAVDLMDTQIKQNEVTLRLILADQIPTIPANAVQIQQVLLNLVRNSLEAMEDTQAANRKLTIQTSLLRDDTVQITICDTGKGLSQQAVKDIFKPFVTTKPEGLGIGLSISQSIIEANHGRLWVTPNPDCGVTFRFTLPTTAEHDSKT